MLVLLLSELSTIQARKVGSHADWSYRWISLDGRKQLRLIGYSPSRHLIQNHVRKGFQIACRRGEGKGLALDDD
jgi:hypothetical protein